MRGRKRADQLGGGGSNLEGGERRGREKGAEVRFEISEDRRKGGRWSGKGRGRTGGGGVEMKN